MLGRTREAGNPQGSNSVASRSLNSQRTPDRHSVRLHPGAGAGQLGSACALRLGRITAGAVTRGQTGRRFQWKNGRATTNTDSCTRGPVKAGVKTKGWLIARSPRAAGRRHRGAPQAPARSHCKVTESGRYSLQQRPAGTKREGKPVKAKGVTQSNANAVQKCSRPPRTPTPKEEF